METLEKKRDALARFSAVIDLAKITVANQIAKNPDRRDPEYRKIGGQLAMESIDYLEGLADCLAAEIAEIEKGV